MRVFNDGAPGWKHIITSDGRGYYAYLPALILDHDPTFARVVEREARLLAYPHYKPGYLVKSGDRVLNKYFAGEALLLLPFFLMATLCSFITGTEINGYSFFFQIFTGIGALFYLFMALVYLKRILDSLKIRPGIIGLTLGSILFGTNLFYYGLWQPTMSHVFSFFAINGFMWYTRKAFIQWRSVTAFRMGIFLGLVFLIRPTNIMVILLIPFFAENQTRLVQVLRLAWTKKRALLLLVLSFLAMASVQGVLWYIQTGHFVVWSYRGEGFNFRNPEIINVLFSYRKGLFIYTPLILISWCGLTVLILKKQLQFFSMAIFLVTATYVVSSWWNWYYGDGFGLRAFIDYYGVFAILLALILNFRHSTAWVTGLLLLILPCIALNLVQTWQYTHQVIQPNSMNTTKYHYVFMRTDSAVINCLGGNEEIADYPVNTAHAASVFTNSFEKPEKGWSANAIVVTPRAWSGSHAGYLDSLHQFSSGIAIKADEICRLPATCYVTGELMVWDSLPGASNGALVVLSMDSIQPGENYWHGFKLNDLPLQTTKTWRKCTFSLMLPEISNPEGTLKIYIWNTKKKPMLIDDFKVRFYSNPSRSHQIPKKLP